jgi:hypothetical protein
VPEKGVVQSVLYGQTNEIQKDGRNNNNMWVKISSAQEAQRRLPQEAQRRLPQEAQRRSARTHLARALARSSSSSYSTSRLFTTFGVAAAVLLCSFIYIYIYIYIIQKKKRK